MNWPPGLYSSALFTSALVSLLVSLIAWRRRSAPGALSLSFMFLSTFVWTGGNGFLLESTSAESRLFWLNILLTGAVWGTPAVLAFALQYTGRAHWLTRRNLIYLCLPPALTALLMWTNEFHRLVFAKYDLTVPLAPGGGWATPGIAYLAFLLYSYPLALFSIALIIQAFFRSPPLYRGQAGVILIGILIPLSGNIFFNLLGGPEKGWRDPTPILSAVEGLLFAYGLFAFRLFEIVPIARHTLVERMTDGILVLDAKNRIIDINPAAIRLLRLNTAPLIGQALDQLPSAWAEKLSSLQNAASVQTELKIEHSAASYFDLRIETLLDRQDQPNGRLVIFRDITEKKQAEEELQQAHRQLQRQIAQIENLQVSLREQAIRDGLTGLYNRRHQDETLKAEMDRARRYGHPLGLLMIEIDSFKDFNDLFGHDAGDLVLRKVGEMIQTSARTSDTACRYGGDEFVLILPETSCEAARQFAERLRKEIAGLELQYLGKTLGKITISIGVAGFPDHGGSADLILRAADKAMYHVKQTGKNRVDVAKRESHHE